MPKSKADPRSISGPTSRRLLIAGPARCDLVRIGEYTRRRWGADQKRRYLEQMGEALRLLRDTPGMGTPRDHVREGLRGLAVGSHVVFYRETADAVVVARILHRAMDPDRHLGR